jgi:hypothetical protein
MALSDCSGNSLGESVGGEPTRPRLRPLESIGSITSLGMVLSITAAVSLTSKAAPATLHAAGAC